MDERTMLETLDADVTRRLAAHAPRAGRLATGPMGAVGLAAAAHSAYAQGGLPQQVVDVLNYALTLEYLESSFYIQGVDSGIIPATSTVEGDHFRDLALFTTIRDHEVAHVAFLQGALGSAAVARPTFDFTARGAFSPFTDYEQFKLLAQAFEDTGVRAYKGQVGALQSHGAVLKAAVTIHSVEARHASEVRRLRGLQGWIPLDQPGAPRPVQPVYAGEERVEIQPAAVGEGVTLSEVTEAFDEPLTMAQVLAIAGAFIVH